MEKTVQLPAIYIRSNDVIARTIDNQLLIIPLTAGMVDADDSLYTLTPTAQDIWNLLDGERTLLDVVDILSVKYEVSTDTLEEDVLGFITEMVNEKLIRQK